jgi:hypothetical protein
MSCSLNWYLRFSLTHTHTKKKKKKKLAIVVKSYCNHYKKIIIILSTNASLTIIEGEFADPNVI